METDVDALLAELLTSDEEEELPSSLLSGPPVELDGHAAPRPAAGEVDRQPPPPTHTSQAVAVGASEHVQQLDLHLAAAAAAAAAIPLGSRTAGPAASGEHGSQVGPEGQAQHAPPAPPEPRGPPDFFLGEQLPADGEQPAERASSGPGTLLEVGEELAAGLGGAAAEFASGVGSGAGPGSVGSSGSMGAPSEGAATEGGLSDVETEMSDGAAEEGKAAGALALGAHGTMLIAAGADVDVAMPPVPVLKEQPAQQAELQDPEESPAEEPSSAPQAPWNGQQVGEAQQAAQQHAKHGASVQQEGPASGVEQAAQQARRSSEQCSLLQLAEGMERRLTSGSEEGPLPEPSAGRAAYHQDLLVASLVSQLESRAAAGPDMAGEEGHTDERGTAVGRLAAARAFLSPNFEQLFRGPQHHGMPSALTKYRGMVAVGTSSGSLHVLMPAGKKDAQGQSRLTEVSERAPGAPALAGGTSGGDGVTALCFGQHGGSLLMLSGHASGALKVWELKSHLTGSVNWVLSKTLGNVHGSAITACAVLEGGPTTWALSADAHGRLMCHNVSRHLSVAAQALTSFARQLTGGGSIPSHLISLQAAGQDPGVVLEVAPLHAQRGPAGPAAAADHAGADFGAFLFVPDLGHFVLLCASRAILLCLLTQEGRMQVLHVFLPPLNTPSDCSPYAAWHLEAAQQAQQLGAAVSAVVTVAWQSSVSVYRAVLLWRRPVPQGRRQLQQEPAEHQPHPPPALLNTWVLQNPVCGASFLDSGTLVVAASSGETATEVLVYSQEQYSSPAHKLSQPQPSAMASSNAQTSGQSAAKAGDASVERMVIKDWVVGGQVVPVGGSTYHNGMASFGEQMLLLTSQGIRVIQLMTWQQRLSALIAQHRMERALLAAVNIFHALSQPAGAARWPGDGAGATAPEVSRQLLVILCGLVDRDLAVPAGGHEVVQAVRPDWLAEVAITACLLLRRPEALLSDVFPRWQRTVHLGVFLQQLEPHILRDELPSLGPEVMQALVEHFVALGHPERVERCVLKMDIMSLDLNQLIPLCLRHRLYGALLHIFTGAMLDYQTPASLLLVAAAAELDREPEVAAPPGSSADEASHVALATQVAAGACAAALLTQQAGLRLGYKLLVFLKCCLEGGKYPPGSGPVSPEQQHAVKVQAVAFLLYANALSVWECWGLWGEMAHAEDARVVRELPLSIADPHPALRLLCRMDAAATLGLLRHALHEWDAVEADLADIVPSVAQQLPATAGDRTMTQAVIDAVVDLIQTSALSSSSGGATAAPASPAEPAGTAETTALQFVADHLASNRAVVPPSIVMRILAHLAEPGQQAQRMQQAQQAGGDVQGAEREGVFRDVFTHAAAALGEVDKQEAVWLARRAGFLQAEARIRDLEGAHGEALACLTRDHRHPEAPFKYVRDLLGDPSTPQRIRDAIQASVLQQMAQLMQLNATSAAQLVLDCFPQQQAAVLGGLALTPRLQFSFLKSLVEVQQRLGAAGSKGEGTEVSFKATSRDPCLQPLLSDMAVANLFVELLCQFDPAAVLPFLQSHDSYGVDECLRQCLRHRVQDGAAFLLERRGDVHSALKIYIQALDSANKALVDCMRKGGAEADLLVASVSPATRLAVQVDHQFGGARLRQMTPLWGAARGGSLGMGGLSPGPQGAEVLLPELQAAQEALRNAIAVCARYSQDRLGVDAGLEAFPGAELLGAQGAAAATADPLQRLWFQVLQGYVVMIRELRKEEHQLEVRAGSVAAGEEGTAEGSAAIEDGTAAADELERHRQRVLLLQQIFTGFMEEVIRGMAGHVPMKAIAEAIIHQYGSDQFGHFKSTLLGLLGACKFELSILRCANRVMGSDGARILAGGYRECSRPVEAPTSLSRSWGH